ncbi:hypothetical protein CEXT_212711 [Caerostris extrusa]|uniref:Uncharacterized protein n=1 Tax=Caerostris extrusa TaxID=172846 RepID=A0AAV4QCG2_CAEEX|nr:hypothetical protein CEXT_212711 [Caerostris extrusa]
MRRNTWPWLSRDMKPTNNHSTKSFRFSNSLSEKKKKNLVVSNRSGISKQCDGIHGHWPSGKTNAILFAKRGIHYDDPLFMSVREINI